MELQGGMLPLQELQQYTEQQPSRAELALC